MFSIDTQNPLTPDRKFVLPVSKNDNGLDIDVNMLMAMNAIQIQHEPSKNETHTGISREEPTREKRENPVMSIAKGTVWGGLGGLILGTAIAAAVPGAAACELVRWLFVGGTAAGLGYGIHDVTSHP
tara:strand:- start:2467 stop:2847 length:381 start_codon:yes stop_codon:yes gene_type:complete